MHNVLLKVIAHIYTPFKEKFGIPRQSGRVKNAMGKIVFTKEFNNIDSVKRIQEFSHLWLIFDFSKAHVDKYQPLVRPPRLGGNEKVGVFSSRSPFRPNPIGLSSVKLEKVEIQNGNVCLVVSGVDTLDGTPIFDIKPYIPSTDCHIDAVGGYADDFTNYKLNVEFDNSLREKIPQDKLQTLVDCLAEDPRPSYHLGGKVYGMAFENYNVKFSVKQNTLTVNEIEEITK